MKPVFEITDGNYEGSIAVALHDNLPKFPVTKSAIPGYVLRYLHGCDGMPPITAAQAAFGELWYGPEKPDLILSSEAMMKRMVRCIAEEHLKPVMYGNNFGFMFNDARWSHPGGNGFEIEDGWVFMLNTKNPTNFMLNGCYKPMEMV